MLTPSLLQSRYKLIHVHFCRRRFRFLMGSSKCAAYPINYENNILSASWQSPRKFPIFKTMETLLEHFGRTNYGFISKWGPSCAWIFFRKFSLARIFFSDIFPCMNFFFGFFAHSPHHFSNGPSLKSGATNMSRFQSVSFIFKFQISCRTERWN